MKKILSSVLVSIFLFSCLFPQNLTLSLILDKKEYLKGEPIYGLAILKNNSSAIKAYPLQGTSALQLLIMDSSKVLLGKAMAHSRLEYAERDDLQQDETMGCFMQISRCIANDPSTGISLWEPNAVKTGRYFLQLMYTYHDTIPDSKQQKEFYSDPMEINVVDPQSEIDKIVYKMLTDSSKIHLIDTPIEERAGYAQMLLDLIKKYPDSRYFPSAYYNLFYAFSKSDYYKFDDIIENMFSKYPESVMNIFSFSMYEAHRKDIFNSMEFYKKINDRTKEKIRAFNKHYRKLIKGRDDSLR